MRPRLNAGDDLRTDLGHGMSASTRFNEAPAKCRG